MVLQEIPLFKGAARIDPVHRGSAAYQKTGRDPKNKRNAIELQEISFSANGRESRLKELHLLVTQKKREGQRTENPQIEAVEIHFTDVEKRRVGGSEFKNSQRVDGVPLWTERIEQHHNRFANLVR